MLKLYSTCFASVNHEVLSSNAGPTNKKSKVNPEKDNNISKLGLLQEGKIV
jgi:hypothetical protein